MKLQSTPLPFPLSYPLSSSLILYPLSSYPLASSALILSHPLSSSLIRSHPLSSSLIRSHPLSSFLILSHPLSSSLILSHPLSSSLILSHPLLLSRHSRQRSINLYGASEPLPRFVGARGLRELCDTSSQHSRRIWTMFLRLHRSKNNHSVTLLLVRLLTLL